MGRGGGKAEGRQGVEEEPELRPPILHHHHRPSGKHCSLLRNLVTPPPPSSKWQALFSFEKSGYSITTIVQVASTVLF
jgi:hypothetical protein